MIEDKAYNDRRTTGKIKSFRDEERDQIIQAHRNNFQSQLSARSVEKRLELINR